MLFKSIIGYNLLNKSYKLGCSCKICIYFARMHQFLLAGDTIDILYLVYLNFCKNKYLKTSYQLANIYWA